MIDFCSITFLDARSFGNRGMAKIKSFLKRSILFEVVMWDTDFFTYSF
ncbi:hypothetical protein CHELA20_54316 [Hyphomicrobiales bacterium]|nr:hypothetical protein CHELA41_20612 [Hyphomicrobiales bacterium]CAH1686020.1 hypothetical protein CHELA20_54316 [Hyphomicrobiales bacterium]